MIFWFMLAQLSTPTPRPGPPPGATALPALPGLDGFGSQMAVEAVGFWNDANNAGLLTMVQVGILVLIVLGGIMMIMRQLRDE